MEVKNEVKHLDNGHGVYGSGKTWRVRELKIGQGMSGKVREFGLEVRENFCQRISKILYCLFSHPCTL